MGRRYSHLATKTRALVMGLGAAFAGFSTYAALASESALLPNPTGGTDINQATLPPAGLYGFLAGVQSESFSYNDQHGNTSGAQKYDNPTMLGGLLFVYPWEVFGGQIASSVVPQEHASTLRLDGNVKVSSYPGGIGDTYSDLLWWTKNIGLFGVTPGNNPYIKYGLNIAGGLAVKIPTGPYSSKEPAGIAAGGNNLFVWVPDIAFTYNTGPNWSFFDSTQVSARVYYAIPEINPATHYQSGDVVDIDFSVTQQAGHWRFGLAGAYASQVTDDLKNGIVVGATPPQFAPFGSNGVGKRWESLWLGPIVSYVWDNGIQFKAKYAQIVENRAQVNQDIFAASVGFPLWQPERLEPQLK